MDDKNLYDELFNNDTPSETSSSPKNGLNRSANNFIVAGVCGGIAEYVNKDVKLIRLITLLLFLTGWFPILVYLILTFLLPVSSKIKFLSDEEIIFINKQNNKIIFASIILIIGFYFSLKQFNIDLFGNLLILKAGFLFSIFIFTISVMILINKIKLPKIYLSDNSDFVINKNDKLILGVCSALGKYLEIDVITIRFIFLILTFLTLGVFILFYLSIYFFYKFD